ncbi:cobalt ECF transporter T component CbiQ [Cellulosilyticum sp. I15G10I2]|uniref:cobalt ECF transporter T component CbiQ n=1 Tax=Cellulosilyticum sp. I15G10I2 TaxID=1892843 RepID=UPI00085C0A75|nr:cobalt ECF transporter T component CbiQ [Cellulosilyticum sp. I15G10I2]
MLIIDKIAYNNRLAHTNPYLKCGLGAAFLILSVLWDNLSALATIIIGMNILIMSVAKVNKKIYIKLISFPSVFIISSILATLFYFSNEAHSFLFYLQFFGYYIGYSKLTLIRSAYILMRCFAAISCIYFITLTTGFNQMILVLKKLHMPKEVIEIIMLVYRFIFIFLEEVSEIYIAQEMRFGYINIKTAYRSLGILISTLFTRIMIRYQDMSIALDTKLYDGEFYI